MPEFEEPIEEPIEAPIQEPILEDRTELVPEPEEPILRKEGKGSAC